MTPAARAFWMRAQRRVLGLEPDVAAALLRAYSIIRESFTDAELARIVETGNLDRLFREALSEDVMDRAFIPVRQRLRQTMERGFAYAVPDLPKAGKINGVVAVAFDHLSPDVITAVRGLETDAIETLKADVRETTRAFIENALRDGTSPRTIARELRSVIGLAPTQEAAVRNFRRMLEAGDAEALSRELRDRRFDGTLRRAFGEGGAGLSAEQVDSMTAAYNRRFVAFNAETNARTITLQSYKAGQSLSWKRAIDAGVIPAGTRLEKTWLGVLDSRERPEHVAMQGETVPFDEPYSNGEMIPGESTFNCRCVSRVRISTA